MRRRVRGREMTRFCTQRACGPDRCPVGRHPGLLGASPLARPHHTRACEGTRPPCSFHVWLADAHGRWSPKSHSGGACSKLVLFPEMFQCSRNPSHVRCLSLRMLRSVRDGLQRETVANCDMQAVLQCPPPPGSAPHLDSSSLTGSEDGLSGRSGRSGCCGSAGRLA